MGNGLGPWWFPTPLRAVLTAWVDKHFPSVVWAAHDLSYATGNVARWVADRGLFRAMAYDALADANMRATMWKLVVAFVFYALCRVFGWMSYQKVRKPRLDEGLE